MNLFSSDLFRNFGVGFLVGAMIIGGATIDQWGAHLESPAQAASPFEAPAPANEFLIESLEISA